MRLKALWLSSIIAIASTVIAISPAIAAPKPPSQSLCSNPAAIVGTDQSETITGTEGNDIICGGAGIDTIDGLGGDDIIIGGSGNDQIVAGGGNDQVAGGAGDDIINGDGGQDALFGEAGIDIVAGDDLEDYISGGLGADHLYGGDGIDQMLGGLGDDGMDGGPGRDILNGEAGDDVCVRDAADKRISCNFDERGPRLINFSMQPGFTTVDATSDDPQKRLIRFRFTVVDPGTGVDSLYVGFKSLTRGNASDFSNSIHLSQDYGSCESLETAISSMQPSVGLAGNFAGYCLIAGNKNRGVYEGAALVARNAVTGTWVLTLFQGTDSVGNRTSVGDHELAQQKMRVKFKQVGLTDSVSPTFIDASLTGKKILTDRSDSTTVLITFSDNQSNLSNVHLSFRAASYDAYLGQSFSFSNPDEVPTCNESNKGKVACLQSGTLKSGSLLLPISYTPINELPRWFSPSDYSLEYITLTDSFGNRSQLEVPSVKKKAITFRKNFWSGNVPDDGDTTAPIIESLEVTPSRINTSQSDQTVQINLRVSDAGVGLNFDSPEINIELGLKTPINNATGSSNSTRIKCFLISKSGTANLGNYLMNCTIPARFPRGEFVVVVVSVFDASIRANYLYFDPTTSPEAKDKFPIKLRNG